MADQIGWVVVERHDNEPIVKVFGEIDISNASQVEKALDELVQAARARHIVDLTDTTYFDSSGIRVLFSLASRLRSRRQELHIIVPADGITRRVLELTGLPQVVPVHTSLAELPPRA